MTSYNTLKIKLSNTKLNKLKSGIKNGTQITLDLSSNIVCHSSDETIIHKFLLTVAQVSRIHKSFPNLGSLANTEFLKAQLSKMVQLGGFIGRLLGRLIKTGLPLMKNVLKLLAKSISIPLGLTATASATYPATQHEIFG